METNTPQSSKDDLNYDESYNLNETELNILRSLNPKGHIYNDYISNNIRIKAIRAGFLAGQKAEQERILWIIDILDKKNKEDFWIELGEYLDEEYGENNYVIPTDTETEIVKDFVLENIKSQINNSPQLDTSVNGGEHIKQSESKFAINKSGSDLGIEDNSADSSEPQVTKKVSGESPETSGSSNSICECGHDLEWHLPKGHLKKGWCKHKGEFSYDCLCTKFRPAKVQVKEGK